MARCAEFTKVDLTLNRFGPSVLVVCMAFNEVCRSCVKSGVDNFKEYLKIKILFKVYFLLLHLIK